VFVDTSAFFAVIDRDEANHDDAARVWAELLAAQATLLTTSYVLVETAALLQHRIGLAALRSFYEDVVPLLHV
jgi:predicted nucleic acid-binding protein